MHPGMSVYWERYGDTIVTIPCGTPRPKRLQDVPKSWPRREVEPPADPDALLPSKPLGG